MQTVAINYVRPHRRIENPSYESKAANERELAMSEPLTIPDAAHPVLEAATDLEQRVQRLECAVADLQDTHALEERITEKVAERLESHKAVNDHAFSVTAVPPGSVANHVLDYPDDLPPRPLPARHPWLLVDMVASARLLWQMIFDRRFHFAWTTHLVVWTCLAAIALSDFWFPLAWLPILGPYVFDKVLDLLLAFCIYKALSRETRRYREVLAGR